MAGWPPTLDRLRDEVPDMPLNEFDIFKGSPFKGTPEFERCHLPREWPQDPHRENRTTERLVRCGLANIIGGAF